METTKLLNSNLYRIYVKTPIRKEYHEKTTPNQQHNTSHSLSIGQLFVLSPLWLHGITYYCHSISCHEHSLDKIQMFFMGCFWHLLGCTSCYDIFLLFPWSHSVLTARGFKSSHLYKTYTHLRAILGHDTFVKS